MLHLSIREVASGNFWFRFSHQLIFRVCHLQGIDIHVIVSIMFKQAFDSVLSINKTCIITNFQVQLNDLMFNVTDHKYLLKFTGGTTVGDNNKHEIPDKVINFISFPKMILGKWKKNLLIYILFMSRSFRSMNHFGICILIIVSNINTYVIRLVDEIGYTQSHSGSKKMHVNLVLKDLGYVM